MASFRAPDPWPWSDVEDEAACTRALGALHRMGVVERADLAWLEPALKRSLGSPAETAIPWAAWTMRICARAGIPAQNRRSSVDSPTEPPSSWISAGALAIAVTALNARACDRVDAAAGAGREPWPAPPFPDSVARSYLAGRVLHHLARTLAAEEPGEPSAAFCRPQRADRARLVDRIAPWMLGLGQFPAREMPRNPPIVSSVGAEGAEPAPPHEPSASIREAVTLWTASALIAGEDLAPWSRFGEAVAGAIGILDGLVRMWLDPGSHDLRGAVLTPLVGAWLAEPSLRARLLTIYAGERESPVRRFAIHDLVASEPFRACVAQQASRSLALARAALVGGRPEDESPHGRLAAAGADFLGVIEERFRFFDTLMSFRALLKGTAGVEPGSISSGMAAETPRESAPEPERAPLRDADADLAMAVAFLSEGAPWSGSWEVQRAGIFGSKERPVGQWFIRGMILQALLEMGHDARAEVAALLAEIPAGELRYFGAWREIPPDADDLGLMLQLASTTGAAPGRAETWIAVMLANVGDDGVVPTWFQRDPAGRPTTRAAAAWGGDDCSAVRLNLLAGLLSFDAGRFAGLIQKNTQRVLERSRGGDIEGVFYYDDSFTALAFLRFARLHREKAIDQSLAGAIGSAEAAIRARAASSQRLDGGWGSPQRTALCLEGATTAAPHPLLLARAMRYLGDHQLVDGSWPAEPIYRTPMKRGRVGHHQGREITTALCSRALSAAAGALSRMPGAPPAGGGASG